MPFYDYVCRSCGHSFSQFMVIAERDKADCPECKSQEVKRKLAAPFVGGKTSSAPPSPCGAPGGGCGFGGCSLG